MSSKREATVVGWLREWVAGGQNSGGVVGGVSRKGQQENCAVLGSLLSPRVASVQEATACCRLSPCSNRYAPATPFFPFPQRSKLPKCSWIEDVW